MAHAEARLTRTVVALAAGACLAATGLRAQEPPGATLRGVVIDSVSERPVPGVLLRLDTGAETLTETDGRFVLSALPPGDHMVAVLTRDCRVSWTDVSLVAGETSEIRVKVPTDAGAEVAAQRERDERRRPGGRLITARRIAEMNPASIADLIRRVEPNMIGPPSAVVGDVSAIEGRSRNSFRSASGKEEPIVVIDGVRAIDGARALSDLLPSEVETLELLPGASGGWEYGSAGAAGLVRVTTRRFVPAAAPEGAESCTVPAFPGGH